MLLRPWFPHPVLCTTHTAHICMYIKDTVCLFSFSLSIPLNAYPALAEIYMYIGNRSILRLFERDMHNLQLQYRRRRRRGRRRRRDYIQNRKKDWRPTVGAAPKNISQGLSFFVVVVFSSVAFNMEIQRNKKKEKKYLRLYSIYIYTSKAI